MTDPLVVTTTTTSKNECNICFDENINTITCGRESCSFAACNKCILEYNKSECPHCNFDSINYKNIINTREEKLEEFWKNLYGENDPGGCCIIINEPNRFRISCCDFKNRMYAPCLYVLLLGTLSVLSGMAFTAIVCSVGLTTAIHSPVAIFCYGALLNVCACICCNALNEQVIRKSYVTDSSYYGFSLLPPSFCSITRDERSIHPRLEGIV